MKGPTMKTAAEINRNIGTALKHLLALATVICLATNASGQAIETIIKPFYCTNFDCPDGAHPFGGVMQGKDGFLYGTTSFGGPPDYFGGIFKVKTDGTGYTNLFWFGDHGTFGASFSPYPPIQGADGKLYGTTAGGFIPSGSGGTLFRMNTDGSGFTLLHVFLQNSIDHDGEGPFGGLIQ